MKLVDQIIKLVANSYVRKPEQTNGAFSFITSTGGFEAIYQLRNNIVQGPDGQRYGQQYA